MPDLSNVSGDAWLQFLGRLHPLLLHAPLGVLLALVGLELWTKLLRRKPELRTRRLLALMTALTAAAAAASGWYLGQEPGYEGTLFVRHRALALAFAAACGLVWLSALVGFRRAYGWLLVIACLLAVAAGHYGASMTHGADFLLEPLRPAQPEDEGTPAAGWYAARIRPFFESRCSKCHGPGKQKGDLALHEPELILAGGESGPALVPGDTAASRMLERLRLPLEHDDHMPPEGKSQPSEAELDLLERWIAAGASFDAPLPADLALESEPAAGAVEVAAAVTGIDAASPDLAGEPAVRVMPGAALAALRSRQVHVETIEPTTDGLWVDFRAVPDMDAAWAAPILAELAPWLLELSLAGVRDTTELVLVAATSPRLDALDLSRAELSADDLAALHGHATLRTLNLSGTRAGDGIVPTLAALPALRRVNLWGAELTADGLAELREARPDLELALGDKPPAAPLETEPPVQLTSLPSLTPVNGTCPVSGDPIDPAFGIVHEGRVIGFCCSNCPKEFWADPGAFTLTE